MFVKIRILRHAFVLAALLPFHALAQLDTCWQQHRATVHEWTCAGQSLSARAQPYAFSIVVVESPKALMVIDSGATAAVGESAAAAIRSKFGTKPVWILNSQAKAEHVLGNTAFKDAFAGTLRGDESFSDRLVAGQRTADQMRLHCTSCIERLSQITGSPTVSGTQFLVPDRILKRLSGHLGILQSDWVPWKYRLYQNLEADETLVLRNQELKLWWVASAVQNREVPDLYDGDITERIDFLARLKTQMTSDDTVLTSFGALGPDWIERNLAYFVRVHQAVLYGLEASIGEVEMIEQLSAQTDLFMNPVYVQTDPEASAKSLERHQLNVQRIYRQTQPFVF
ncbi:hypothetical protein [Limnobacter parvus]|uniref:MBL fold metallo-hydrolase n=1 Tax=Limnobacter parvus TaxID=2939690 RepID=A0ABT1XF10_9BURK|nr:hypothetical protein [Limnobacter parvus]MCR2745486.1 hypothetical protein [Limnobacter parvus]